MDMDGVGHRDDGDQLVQKQLSAVAEGWGWKGRDGAHDGVGSDGTEVKGQ